MKGLVFDEKFIFKRLYIINLGEIIHFAQAGKRG